jgi:hypothetical protein
LIKKSKGTFSCSFYIRKFAYGYLRKDFFLYEEMRDCSGINEEPFVKCDIAPDPF